MIYLISIVFIAELIILYHLASFLIKADKAVCIVTEHVNKRRMILKWRLLTIKDITEGINEIFPTLVKKAKKTKRNIIVSILTEILQSIILIFFKPKYKKMLLGAKTGIRVAKKILKV